MNGRYYPPRYADGGTTDATKTVNFGGVGQLEPVNTSAADSTLSDSERTQNYLMGNGPNPFAFYHSNEKKVAPVTKASDSSGIAAIGGGNIGGGNGNIGGGGGNIGGGIGGLDGGDGGLGGGDVSSVVGTSDTGGEVFGVTGQPDGTTFDINDFDTDPNTFVDTNNEDFGVTGQPDGATFDINDFDTNPSTYVFDTNTENSNVTDGTTFDINDFDNNTSAGTVDNGPTFDINDFDNNTSAGINDIGNYGDTSGEIFGVTNQPDGATFDINDFDNNTSVGTGEISGNYTGSADEGMDNVDTSNSEIFGKDYINPSGTGAENNFVDRMDALNNYADSDFGVTNQPDSSTFNINDFNNNTNAGTGETSGDYTGSVEESVDNVDTSNPEIFAQGYIDPRTNPFEDNANRLEQQEMTEGYFGGDAGNVTGS
jgi:hypothetical protein